MSGENILKGCLVESDPAAIARARQAKRRALIIAIVLQVLLVGLLVLAPLLGAMEKLPNTISFVFCPRPPYRGTPRGASRPKSEKPPQGKKRLPITKNPVLVQPDRIPPTVAEVKDPPEVFAAQAEPGGERGGKGDPDGLIDLFDPNARPPAPPKPPESSAPKPKGPVLVLPTVQEARLVHRVDPMYPPLPRSTGIEGKVVLRAVISRDGTIQSLEVLSGHVLFVTAAREAIAQWRYQPTLLHGEPVEVETVITVVFTLKR
ncbi:MAG: TonB family protein [Acidobacteria bacterium]|nr:TonB family protein [Acidobacteriota bacterium]